MPADLRSDLIAMRAAAADAIVILGPTTLLQLERNREKQAALCYLGIVIGEMAARISRRHEDAYYPQIDWPRIVGMRNMLAHQPEITDLDDVRQTIIRDYPVLIAAVDAILRELI